MNWVCRDCGFDQREIRWSAWILTGATQLQHLLTDAGEANQANEIGQHIAKAQHLR
jgi:hypothetical protein